MGINDFCDEMQMKEAGVNHFSGFFRSYFDD